MSGRPTIARIERLSFSYPDSAGAALGDVSLELRQGEVTLVLGRSGSGKSTLLRALAGLVPHFHGGRFSGSVSVAGFDTRSIAPAALAAALVGLASAVVAATAGSVVRVIAACSALMAAALGAVVVISVLVDPGGALGRLAVAGTGRTGTVAAHGRVGGWAWVALAAMLVMGIGGLGALAGRRGWRGLSSRYDVAEPAAGPASSASAWDQLSRGEDPTAGH